MSLNGRSQAATKGRFLASQLGCQLSSGEIVHPTHTGRSLCRHTLPAMCASEPTQGTHPTSLFSKQFPCPINRNRGHAMTKRAEYIQKMKSQLDALNATMGEIEAKAKDAKEEARARYKEEAAKLRHQSKAAASKLEDLKSAGEDRWEAMVTEMDKMRDAFVHSFNYFKSQV